MDPLSWAGLLSPVGCVIFLFVALTRGWLVPKREVERLAQQNQQELDRLTKQWDDRLNEAHVREQVWQRVALTSEETRQDVADQLRTRQVIDEVVVKTISAVPAAEGS